jgi:hypothetical protein
MPSALDAHLKAGKEIQKPEKNACLQDMQRAVVNRMIVQGRKSMARLVSVFNNCSSSNPICFS